MREFVAHSGGLVPEPPEYSVAVFSADEQYRSVLQRQWDKTLPLVGFICLNPSTATEQEDDNTTKKLRKFAKQWGYGGYVLTNIFDIRSTDPSFLYRREVEPSSNLNDVFIDEQIKNCKSIVCAWGNHGVFLDRGKQVKKQVFATAKPHCIFCFRVTKLGQPQHPLYLRDDTKIISWG